MIDKFHILYPTKSGTYYVAGDCLLQDILTEIKYGLFRLKRECPAALMNRFTKDNDGRVRNSYAHLDYTTGYYAVDIDKADRLSDFLRNALFDCPELLAVWKSSSGRGVKGIGYNPILANLSPDEFKQAYRDVCNSLIQQCGFRINFDYTSARCHQPVFLNLDPFALIRDEYHETNSIHPTNRLNERAN